MELLEYGCVVGSYLDFRTTKAMEIQRQCVMIKNHFYIIVNLRSPKVMNRISRDLLFYSMLPFFTVILKTRLILINIDMLKYLNSFILLQNIMNMLLKYLKEN